MRQTDELLTTRLIHLLFVGVQFEKQPLLTPTSDSRTPFSRKHWRSRSLGGIIKVNLCALNATSPFITNNITYVIMLHCFVVHIASFVFSCGLCLSWVMLPLFSKNVKYVKLHPAI